jgi:phosphoserine phosphatase
LRTHVWQQCNLILSEPFPLKKNNNKVAGQYACWRMMQLLRPALRAEIKKHQQANRAVSLLSGNLAPIIGPLAKALNCDYVCSELEHVDGCFTGKLTGPIMVGRY